MKLRCRREPLLAAVQLAAAAVPSRDIKPVLRNLKATTQPGRCNLLATDLELGLRLDLDGLTVEEPEEALLPAKRLLDILRESSDEEFAVEADANSCLVRGQWNEFEMPAEDPAHFPDVPAFEGEQCHEIPAGVLRELVRRTTFAAADQNVRYALAGTLWECDDRSVRLVATDGRRLAVAEGTATTHDDHATNGQPHVVPTKAMELLERNLRNPEETVRVSLRPNEALFQTGRAVIYSRLLEGRYPAYREVIPKKPAAKVPLTAGPFLTAIRQAAVMADTESRKVTFTFAKKKLTLHAQGAETGRSKVELPIDYRGTKAVEISFAPGLLTDMLKTLDPEAELTLEMTDGKGPALFRCGDGYSYVVMPLS